MLRIEIVSLGMRAHLGHLITLTNVRTASSLPRRQALKVAYSYLATEGKCVAFLIFSDKGGRGG